MGKMSEWNSPEVVSGILRSLRSPSACIDQVHVLKWFCLKEFKINLMSCFSENSEKAMALDRVRSRLIKLAHCLLAFVFS